MTESDSKPDYYWASSSSEDLVDHLHDKHNKYIDYIQMGGYLNLWRRAHQLYFGRDSNHGRSRSSSVSYDGEQGELAVLRSNQFGSYINNIFVLITGTRPTLVARGLNASSAAQTAAKMAESVFEYYLSQGNLEKAIQEACLFALRYGEGWVAVTWNPNFGNATGVRTAIVNSSEMTDLELEELISNPELAETKDIQLVDRIEYEGDIEIRTFMPVDVIRDVNVDIGTDSFSWLALSHDKSRWDLVALYPEYKDQILNAPSRPNLTIDVDGSKYTDNYDMVHTLEFYHERTPAMPNGRYCLVVGEVVLVDTELPYDEIPIMCMRPSKESKTAFGYSNSWDLMGLQDVLDSVVSAIVTNHDAFATPKVWIKPGSKYNVQDLSTNLALLEGTDKPELIDLMPDMQVSVQLTEMINKWMSQISGINEVARGNPEANVKSGAMAALIHSMAVQFNSGLQASYADLYEKVGTHFLDCARRYMKTPRMIAVSGPRGSSWVTEFKGSDLDGVQRISVESGAAIMRTSAGRQQIADTLLQVGMLNKDEYMSFITTGRLEPLLDLADTKLRGILAENDRMIRGIDCKVIITDHHIDHIKAHISLLNEPSNRENEEMCELVLDHIQRHIDIYQRMSSENVAMLAIMGIPPLPPNMPPEQLAADALSGNEEQMPKVNSNAEMPGDKMIEEGSSPIPPAQGEILANTAVETGVNPPGLPKLPGSNKSYNPEGGN